MIPKLQGGRTEVCNAAGSSFFPKGYLRCIFFIFFHPVAVPSGSELEERLAAVVHPERGALAKMVRALEQKETEAQGLQAVLNNLLREART